MGWMMPAETARQERLWMAFPREGYTLGNDGESAELARRTWSAVAHAAAEFEPVTMLVDPTAMADARRHLSAEIEVVETPLHEFWMRDTGPTFVFDELGALGGDNQAVHDGEAFEGVFAVEDAGFVGGVFADGEEGAVGVGAVDGGAADEDGELEVLVVEFFDAEGHLFAG